MGKRILVIDDEPSVRKSFQLALEDTDYCIEAVSSGLEGIETHKKEPCDLIFLDLKMPGLNGVETLNYVRGFDRTTPIYVITAFYEEYFNELKKSMNSDIDFELMQKPIGAEQIISVVKSILEGSPD
jgi:CheY-like chemotaxis protein